MKCAYCTIDMDEDDLDEGDDTPEGPMHDSCYIDWRDNAVGS